MNTYEIFVCDYFLTSYDADASFDQVMDDVLNYEVDVWEMFEDETPETLISMMKDMASGLSRTFVPRAN